MHTIGKFLELKTQIDFLRDDIQAIEGVIKIVQRNAERQILDEALGAKTIQDLEETREAINNKVSSLVSEFEALESHKDVIRYRTFLKYLRESPAMIDGRTHIPRNAEICYCCVRPSSPIDKYLNEVLNVDPEQLVNIYNEVTTEAQRESGTVTYTKNSLCICGQVHMSDLITAAIRSQQD